MGETPIFDEGLHDGDSADLGSIPRLFDEQGPPQPKLFGGEGEGAGAGSPCDINNLFNKYHDEERLDNENCDPDTDLDTALEDLNA